MLPIPIGHFDNYVVNKATYAFIPLISPKTGTDIHSYWWIVPRPHPGTGPGSVCAVLPHLHYHGGADFRSVGLFLVSFFRANNWSILPPLIYVTQTETSDHIHILGQTETLSRADRKLPILACNIKVTSKPPLALAKEERRGRRRERGAENVSRNGSCCSEVGELDRTGQRDRAQRQTSQTKPMCILGQRCTFPNAQLTLNTTERRTRALVLTHKALNTKWLPTVWHKMATSWGQEHHFPWTVSTGLL